MVLREIILHAGISDDPGYYSGRSATLSDLNSEILEKIYQGIRANYGEDAGNNFIQMVDEMERLSATAFLQSLYHLQRQRWKYTSNMLTESDIYANSVGSALGTIASRLYKNDHDDTIEIKRAFLKNHGININGKRHLINGFVYYC